MRTPPDRNISPHNAFTLPELLVVIAIILLLGTLLIPVAIKAEVADHNAVCLANLKALSQSWILYANDNNDRLIGAGNWVAGVMIGATISPSMTNTQPITDGRLWKYHPSLQIYQCPAEPAWPPGAAQQVQRVLSYSLNCNSAGASVQGRGPNGKLNAYPPFTQLSQIRFPGPARNLTFIHENEYSIDDGCFAIEVGGNDPIPTAVRWRNQPTGRHNNGAVLGFADGHSEHWKWTQDYLSKGVFRPGFPGNLTVGSNGADAKSPPGAGNGFPVYYPPMGAKDPDLQRISLVILDKLSWDLAERGGGL